MSDTTSDVVRDAAELAAARREAIETVVRECAGKSVEEREAACEWLRETYDLGAKMTARSRLFYPPDPAPEPAPEPEPSEPEPAVPVEKPIRRAVWKVEPKPDAASVLAVAKARWAAQKEAERAREAEARKAEPEDEPEADEPEAYEAKLPALVPQQGEVLAPLGDPNAAKLAELSKKHAVIGNFGGACMVMSMDRDGSGYVVPIFQTKQAFKDRYSNRYVQVDTGNGGTKLQPLGEYWFRAPRRRQYEGVAFDPEGGVVLEGNRFNLWTGFAVQEREGDWGRMREHIYEVVGSGVAEYGQYIERWLAWTVQNPGKRAEAVLALRGREGTGKGTLANAMCGIFGPHGLPLSQPDHLLGAFSGHLLHCAFLFLDEAIPADGSKGTEGRLKSLVTEPRVLIHPKYVAPFPIDNRLHIMMATNNDWAIRAGMDARRYAVFDVSDARMGDEGYFDALYAELKSGGLEAMLWDLRRMPLAGWHPKRIVKTKALMDQKQHSLWGLDAWAEGLLQEGALPRPVKDYPNRCLSQHLLEAALKFNPHTNSTLVAKKLQELFEVTEFNTRYARGWALPPLPVCRAMWERRNGAEWEWLNEADVWRG